VPVRGMEGISASMGLTNACGWATGAEGAGGITSKGAGLAIGGEITVPGMGLVSITSGTLISGGGGP